MLRRYGFILTAALLLSAAHGHALTLANIVDLRTAGSSGTANGALFTQISSPPTGTGYIDPFLRLQHSPIEEAFNTDYRSSGQAPLDAKSDPNFTHSLTVGSLATITQGGTDYYKFTLDIDEPNAGQFKYISLDDFELYVADRGNIESLATLHSEGVLKWDMDGAGDATVYLNGGNLSSGNGSDDMQVLIPKSFFNGVDPAKYLYLYSKFGATSGMGADNYDANASFEEWRAELGPPPSAAEPSTITLIGGGLLGLAMARSRMRKKA
jgi:hypothetical protein